MKKLLAWLISFSLLCVNVGVQAQSESPLPAFLGLSDPALRTYVEDRIYEETLTALDSTAYVVEEISSVYISKEYLEEVAFNAQANVYFGYTLEEINNLFSGNAYIFTLSDQGKTTVQEMVELTSNVQETILKNVAIGSGVILISVTISLVSPVVGAPAAVTAILMASAKGATTFALSSAAFGGVMSALVKGYETGDFEEALKAGAIGTSEGFQWGAISGALALSAKEAMMLKSGTQGGLSMSQVATIQKETHYPLELIKKFNSMEQYQICQNSGLQAQIINGKTSLIRTIDIDYIEDSMTNLQRMELGKPPLDPMGHPFELHHIGQKVDSPLAILQKSEHTQNGNDRIWHILKENFETPSSQAGWIKEKKCFWQCIANLYI